MKEALTKFYEMLNSSEEMQKKIIELDKAFAEKCEAPSQSTDADAIYSFRKKAVEEAVIPVAREAGFDFTSDELLAYDQDGCFIAGYGGVGACAVAGAEV